MFAMFTALPSSQFKTAGSMITLQHRAMITVILRELKCAYQEIFMLTI